MKVKRFTCPASNSAELATLKPIRTLDVLCRTLRDFSYDSSGDSPCDQDSGDLSLDHRCLGFINLYPAFAHFRYRFLICSSLGHQYTLPYSPRAPSVQPANLDGPTGIWNVDSYGQMQLILRSFDQVVREITSNNLRTWNYQLYAKDLVYFLAHAPVIDYRRLISPSTLYPMKYPPARYMALMTHGGSTFSFPGPLRDDPWLPYIATVFYNTSRNTRVCPQYCEFMALHFLYTRRLHNIDPLLWESNFSREVEAAVDSELALMGGDAFSDERVRYRLSYQVKVRLQQKIQDSIHGAVQLRWENTRRLSRWGTSHDWGEINQGQVPRIAYPPLAFNEADCTADNLPLTLSKLKGVTRFQPTPQMGQEEINRDRLAQKLRYRCPPYYDNERGWVIPCPAEGEEALRLDGDDTLIWSVGLSYYEIAYLKSGTNCDLTAHFRTMIALQNGTKEYPILIPIRSRDRVSAPYRKHELAIKAPKRQQKGLIMMNIQKNRKFCLPYCPMRSSDDRESYKGSTAARGTIRGPWPFALFGARDSDPSSSSGSYVQ